MKSEIANLNEKRKRLDKSELADRIKLLKDSKGEILSKQVAEFINLKITEVNYYMIRSKPMTFLCLNNSLNANDLFAYDKKYVISHKQVRLNIKNEHNFGMSLFRELKERFYFDQITHDNDFKSIHEQIYFYLASKMVMDFNEYLHQECFDYDKNNKTYLLNSNYHLADVENVQTFGLFFIYRDLDYINKVIEIFVNIIQIIVERSKNFSEVNIEENNNQEVNSTVFTCWNYTNEKKGTDNFYNIYNLLHSFLDDSTSVKKENFNFTVKKELLMGTVSFGAKFEFTFIPYKLGRCDKIKVTSKADPNNFVFFQDNSHIKVDEVYNDELILSKDNLRLIRKIISNYYD